VDRVKCLPLAFCQQPSAAKRALLMAALALGCLAAARQPAHAYSSFADYVRPIEEGGGGGRLFSGTPADGYTCDVCHRGAEGAKLDVVGLPPDGYVPGMSYEVSFRWPETAPHVALMAEFTDVAGRPTGVTALAPYATWQAGERCEEADAFPAADVCRLGDPESGCCRDLDPNRDACSFPSARSVLWVLDCGSKLARVIWTAPAAGAGDVWFSSSLVTSDVNHDALGDGVTLMRRRLRVSGSSPEVSAATSNCQAVPGALSRSTAWAWLSIVLLVVVLLRRRMRA
jgi:hypothetical protein